MTPTVYLAGPIAGCDEGQAKDWRAYVDAVLQGYGMRGMSPLRCEPQVTKSRKYALSYTCKLYGTPKAIFSKNRLDVQRCDATLAYLPLKNFSISIGTVLETAWAYEAGKMLVVVSDRPDVLNHPLMQEQAGWMLSDLDEACELLGNVLGSYNKGARTI